MEMRVCGIYFRFLPCPICGVETRTKVLRETVLVRYPLFCAKCRQESLVDVVKMKVVLSDSADEPFTGAFPWEINQIMQEEIEEYLAGMGTPEDCAKKIQSRVSIWLAEHQ